MRQFLKWLTLAILLCAILFFGLRYSSIFLYKWKLSKRQDQIAQKVDELLSVGGRLFLFSLDPDLRTPRDTNKDDTFHGFAVLGKSEIVNLQDRTKLLSLLATDIRKSSGVVAMCFNPRHGLRFTSGANVIDFSICFECRQVYPYSFNSEKPISISGNASGEYNAFLDQYGLPKAKSFRDK